MPIPFQRFHIFNSKLRIALFLGILALESVSNAQTVYFVNAGAAPGGDGLSWTSAINDLQHALDIACINTHAEIWVAQGTYYPNKNIGDSSTGPKDRSNTFLLCNHVALYGGFIGDEVNRDERNWDLNITFLSGDIDSLPAIDSTNAYQVVSVLFADSTVILDGFTISGGYADYADDEKFDFSIGGGINLKGSTSSIQNCTITNNHAQTGAGMAADSCALKVNNCTFSQNETILNFGSGGGASVGSDASTFVDCLFDLNHAKSSGGGLTTRVNSSTVLIHCTFQNNSSPRGGGLSTSFTNSLEMVDCIFTGNVGSTDGGAIYNNVNKLTTFHNCLFYENETNGSGGAIFNNSSYRIELHDCDLSNNKAYNGGGVYLSHSLGIIQNTFIRGNEANAGGGIYSLNGMMDLHNSVISGNLAAEEGGAIQSQSGVVKLTNTTLSGNLAGSDGGALYLDGSAGNTYTVINNSILWNNQASFDTASSSASIFIRNNVYTKIASSLIANSGGSENWNSELGLDGGSNIDDDPLFVENILIDTIPVTSGDFHLAINSPAINAGSIDTTGLYIKMTDADKHERIVDGRIDIGAYEFQEESTIPICNIIGPDVLTGFTMADYAGPAGMDSYTWTSTGNGNIIGSPQNQMITILPGAVSSFLVTLSVVDTDGIETTCALKVNIEPDCALYENVHVIYVNANATGANNGVTWKDAFSELKDALQIDCPDVKEIWVATGTYYPEYYSPDRLVTFQLKNGVGLYGGFAGDETLLEERNWITNPVILSGDRDRDGDNVANAYNVVVGSGTDSTAVLDGFTITDGKADGYVYNLRESAGAGIYISNGSPVIRNCTIRDNTSADGSGGLHNFKSSPVISNCTFIHNSATDGISGGMKNSEKSSPLITDCYFIENMARRTGGGMGNYDSSPTLVNCHFDKNIVSSGQGGGMNNSSAIPVLINCTFLENAARNGAGMYNSTASPILVDCTFNNNKGRDGCGMYNTGATPQLTNCHFTGNKTSSDGRGGGMFNQFSSAPVLTGCIFENNYASYYGGGIHNVSSSPVLNQCAFVNNIADEYGGGGMSNLNSFPVLSGCTFENNKSFLYGGGLLNDEGSSASITSCHFMGNIAIQGGGAYIRDDTTTTIHDSFFERNKAWGDGAGIEIWDSSPSITNCIFSGNKADLNGGAIAVQDNSDVDLVNCVLSANRAGLRGGGIHNDGAASIVLTNATMSTNHADISGGTIFNVRAAIIMTNSIIWHNSSGGETQTIAASISNDTNAIANIQYSLVANAGGSGNWNDDAGTDLGNNIDADPLFIQDGFIDTIPDQDMDLHLQELSLCINSGIADTSGLGIPIVDVDGQPRIIQNRIDMGAYEYQGLVHTHPEIEKSDWLIYPNPATEFTELFGSGKIANIVIYDLKGQIIFTHNNITLDDINRYQINVAQWPQGVYSIHLMEKGKAIRSQKLVVVRE